MVSHSLSDLPCFCSSFRNIKVKIPMTFVQYEEVLHVGDNEETMFFLGQCLWEN